MQEYAVIQDSNQLIKKGELVEAITKLEAASIALPHSFAILVLLSKCLFENRQYKKALIANQQADAVDPLNTSFVQIQTCVNTKDFVTASRIANDMLAKHPLHPKAISTLAHIAIQKNDPDTSITLLEKGLSAVPANISMRYMLTTSYASGGYFAKSIQSAKVLVNLDESFDSLWLLIGLQLKYGQYHELLKMCERALIYAGQTKAKLSQIELVKGQALRIIGERDCAISVLQSSLQNDPLNVDAWWALADMKDYPFSDDERVEIKRLIDSTKLDSKRRCVATFAYARASEGVAEHSITMALYKKANELGASQHYHPRALESELSARMQFYSKANISTQADNVDRTLTPIFIVGLPRSGSTLVEQILASHKNIIGTIEQPTLPIIESRAQTLSMTRYNVPLAKGLAKLTPAELSELGTAYLNESALFRNKTAGYFVDKQPFNFRLIGFIHKILPQAIIIDVRRNPLDCGLSLFKQYFHSGVDFSYKLEHIGRVYKSYRMIMDHWQGTVNDKVYDLEYEELVNNPEEQVRGLLEHVGVEFDRQCIHFYQTKRSVHTASSEQVRQPINIKGIGAWRNVQAELHELINTLKLSDIDLNEMSSKYEG